jgi:nucleotide-binding universal stress UspA family protein
MPLDIVAIMVDPEAATLCLAGAAAAAALDGGSRIEGFHVRLMPESLVLPTEEVLTAARRQQFEAAAAARSGKLQEAFRTWIAGAGARGANAHWQEVAADNVASAVATRSRHADLTVLVRPADPEGDAALHAAIFETGRPLLLLPPAPSCDTFGQHLAIAWKASEQAERAVTAALPWLQRAARISVLMVGEEKDEAALPQDLPALLKGCGATPAAVVLQQGDLSVGERLLQAAQALDADGLVLGAYRHNRIMEMILGGVTREALRHAELPLFMMH